VDEVVGPEGIHGHRIETTIRLHLDVTDGSGQPPDHPVLVSLSLGGAHHGTLILDPDGRRIACSSDLDLPRRTLVRWIHSRRWERET
jgi:hypothetical protein